MLTYAVFAIALVAVFYLGVVIGEARRELKITAAIRDTGSHIMPGTRISGFVHHGW